MNYGEYLDKVEVGYMLKIYDVTYKIKGERVWCDECYKHILIEAKTKKEAREKTFEEINEYKYTIVSVDLI